jgi:hypothetical protein
MAVSYRIVIFLIALLVFGGMYAIVSDGISTIEGDISDGTDTKETQQSQQYISQFWTFMPVAVLIAGGAWLIKEAVMVG